MIGRVRGTSLSLSFFKISRDFRSYQEGKKKEKGDSLSAPGWQQSSTGSQRQLPLIYPATPPVSGVGGEVPGASENPSRITTIARPGQQIAVKRRLRR